MIYHLADYFYSTGHITPYWRILRYVTVRAGLAVFTALALSFILGPLVVKILRRYKASQTVRREHCEELNKLHEGKQGTPTMGGILILVVLVITTLLWADLSQLGIRLMLFTTVCLGTIGFLDDYLKLVKKNSKGLSWRYKVMGQIALGIIVGSFILHNGLVAAKLWGPDIDPGMESVSPYLNREFTDVLTVPFFKNFLLPLGAAYLFLAVLVVVASSNAVNLTDGLDGLAIGHIIFCALVYTIFAYVVGNWKAARYLNVLFIQGSAELAVFCAALVGAGIGFLWFNCHPAEMFMGDTGSLSLGGIVGVVALLIKMELVLIIVGGVFVMEALSVILQVGSFRFRRKRVFRCAPLHHHYEFGGLKETKIVVRFWIVGIILALLALSTLKLR